MQQMFDLRLFLLSALLIPIAIGAQVRIEGHAPDLAGKIIRLYTYTDFITENTVLKGESLIDENGTFEIEINTERTQFIKLTCDHIAAHIYVQPDAKYDLEFPLPPPSESRAFGKDADTEVIFNNLDINDINANIIDFNYNYEIFFQRNYELLKKLFSPKNYKANSDSVLKVTQTRNAAKSLFEQLDDFSISMDSLYIGSDSDYFNLYRSSVMGDLMMNSTATDLEIFESYIQPFQFDKDHPEFTRLHMRFYKFYFLKNTDYFGKALLDSAINISGDYHAVSRLMEKDDFADGQERKEIIMAIALQEVWNGNINRLKAAEILEHIKDNGHTAQSKVVAEQILKSKTSNAKGFPLKNFNFEDQFNQRKSLSDLRGSPTLIEFTADWCSACQLENTALTGLSKEFGEDIQFLKINIINELNDLSKEKVAGSISTTYISEYNPIIADLNINRLPHYILLDDEGQVKFENTPRPSEGLETILQKLQTEKRESPIRTIGSKEN